MRHIFLCFLMTLVACSVKSQDIPGSSIVSRTFLSSDGSMKLVQRAYDNGLGDIVQEIRSFSGSTLPSVVVHHEYDEYRRMYRGDGEFDTYIYKAGKRMSKAVMI